MANRRPNTKPTPSHPPLHPAIIPNLCLVFLLATPGSTIPQSILDQLLELALTRTYEDRPPPSLREWLQRVEGIEPLQQSRKVASDIQAQVRELEPGAGAGGADGGAADEDDFRRGTGWDAHLAQQ